jgi:hypothetical protein
MTSSSGLLLPVIYGVESSISRKSRKVEATSHNSASTLKRGSVKRVKKQGNKVMN